MACRESRWVVSRDPVSRDGLVRGNLSSRVVVRAWVMVSWRSAGSPVAGRTQTTEEGR